MPRGGSRSDSLWCPIRCPGVGRSDILWSVGEGGIGTMWTIQLLGGLAARRSQQEVTRFRTQKAASLLAFLAFHAAPESPPQPRELLIEMLWPETEPEAGR